MTKRRAIRQPEWRWWSQISAAPRPRTVRPVFPRRGRRSRRAARVPAATPCRETRKAPVAVVRTRCDQKWKWECEINARAHAIFFFIWNQFTYASPCMWCCLDAGGERYQVVCVCIYASDYALAAYTDLVCAANANFLYSIYLWFSFFRLARPKSTSTQLICIFSLLLLANFVHMIYDSLGIFCEI